MVTMSTSEIHLTMKDMELDVFLGFKLSVLFWPTCIALLASCIASAALCGVYSMWAFFIHVNLNSIFQENWLFFSKQQINNS
jgi:hypothetical protein